MLIESVKLSSHEVELMGLGPPSLPLEKPLQLGRLGKCVVLAGKNGAGKTRLLTLINNVAHKYVSADSYLQIEAEISRDVQAQKKLEERIAIIERKDLQDGTPANSPLLESLRREIAELESQVTQSRKSLLATDALVTNGGGEPRVAFFVPKSTTLEDPTDSIESLAIQRAREFSWRLAAEGAEVSAPAYARSVMRAAVQERGAYPPTPGTPKHDAEIRLLDLLKDLLGDDVGFELSEDLNLRLKGLTDSYDSLLSEGQKVLFQLACMLHAREIALSNCILLLDEPENHLHPAVLNTVIDRLLDLLQDGQIWIATHSVPLIAHLVAKDPDCLWYAEDGLFSRAGRAPGKVLNSLLGGHLGASRVNDLTLMASRYASFLLLRQCLLPPGVIGYGGKDPQLNQIQDVLGRLRIQGRPLALLDFGSGKGRLLDAIAEGADGKPLSGLVDYVAYEHFRADAEHCQKRCVDLYGEESVPRAFDSLDEVRQARGEKFADIAIVCNVLHEIDPDDWLKEFGEGSALAELVKDEGFVLFVEDYAIPVGERAHKYGFLLLDEPELKLLFDISNEDIAKNRFTRNDHAEQKYGGRLIAHAVSADCLRRLSERSRQSAIRSLHERSLDRLERLLQDQHNNEEAVELGRESALVTQLATNSALWLRRNP